METILTLLTERLCLRAFILDDIPQLTQLTEDPRLLEHTPYLAIPFNQHQFPQWIKQRHKAYQQRKSVTLALSDIVTKELMGCISLDDINIFHQNASIGYWLGVPYWGHGYMLEAVKALLDFAQRELNLHRIEAQCLATNIASMKTLLNANFQLEGVQRHKLRLRNQWQDLLLFAHLTTPS